MSRVPKVSKGNTPHVVVFMITVQLPDTAGARVHSGRQVSIEATWGQVFQDSADRRLDMRAFPLSPARTGQLTGGQVGGTLRLSPGSATSLRTLVRRLA